MKHRSSFPGLKTKQSFSSLNIASPVSFGANLTSKSETILLITVRVSPMAKCLPMQLYGPTENGMNAFLLITRSGSLDHRSGIKDSGLRKLVDAVSIV